MSQEEKDWSGNVAALTVGESNSGPLLWLDSKIVSKYIKVYHINNKLQEENIRECLSLIWLRIDFSNLK